ncbi:CAP domain-containing protein [Actinoplanes sichuanensis]|uniref:CAP domain-containing protein n=1 Tax=Actinoplanes sichuanensis TaxID=512349 RepID=A0ABW4AH37_9ACTN|nr:CAP domain-containing protein [Actinoplanes sichuanensis]
MRGPAVGLGLAVVALAVCGSATPALAVSGTATPALAVPGSATPALAYAPPGTPDVAPSGRPPVSGWGDAPVRTKPHRRSELESPTGRAAVPGADPIVASRTAVTSASVAPGPQSPVQQQVLALVNQERKEAGCDPITLDRRLIQAANRHASDMARRGYFDHESPAGEKAGSRVTGAGYPWRRYGENIAKGQDSPFRVMADWMRSPGHRENILDCRLDQMGVGLALAADDTPYWVQDFATPRS